MLYLTPSYREELRARYTRPRIPNFDGTLRECLVRYFWRIRGQRIRFPEVRRG